MLHRKIIFPVGTGKTNFPLQPRLYALMPFAILRVGKKIGNTRSCKPYCFPHARAFLTKMAYFCCA